MSDLVSDFTADVRHGYDHLAPDLAAWSANPADAHARDAVFRFVHTVHGNAGFLNFERFGRLAASAEEALSQMRDGRTPSDAAHITPVLAIITRIGALADAIDAGIGIGAHDEPELIADLGILVPPPRVAAVADEKARSIRLPVEQFEHLALCFEGVAAAHRDLLGRVSDPQLADALNSLTDRISKMDQALSLTRLLPVERLFASLDRIVRQTAESIGKIVTLKASGSELLIDRDVVDGLRDPLLHLIRNALDHGFEMPHIRVAAGKKPQGKLTLAATLDGQMFELAVEDDGAGLDRDAVVKSAAAYNVHFVCAARDLSNDQLTALVCTPGVTTASTSSALSGRGVGLDAVYAATARLGGALVMDDCPGQGVSFTLRVPLRHKPIMKSDAA
jgi:two-component system, chemotaxis family, sensor kinase CheA